jgi:chromosomal replication initiation ATPase DnaA
VPTPQQPRLPLFRGPRFAAEDFREAPSNAEALAWLSRAADWPVGRLALWGEAGCGKTHLLHIWATRLGATFWRGPDVRALPELPEHGLALDDADAATKDETALLHLLNATAEAGLPVLLASRTPPARWPVRLPDLASRLRAMTAVEILPPDDLLLHALLARLLADLQHRVPLPTQEWLLTRLPRTPGVLREAVARLDRAALDRAARGHQGGITRGLARDALADLISADLDDPHSDGGDPAVTGTPAITETTSSSVLPSPPTPPLL